MMIFRRRCGEILTSLAILVVVVAVAHDGQNEEKPPDQMQLLTDMAEEVIQPHMKRILRMVVEAEVSTDCQVHLAKLGQALRKLKPWALRLLDATGKGINGLFQGSLSSPGSYDECVETVLHDDETGEETLRAQYCNIYVKSSGSLIESLKNITALSHRRTPSFVDFQNSKDMLGNHVGYCGSIDCTREDIQKLANKIGQVFSAEVRVKSCVDGRPLPLDNYQRNILCLLGVIVAFFVVGTAVDFWTASLQNQVQPLKGAKKQNIRDGIVVRILLCFSAKANTNLLLNVSQDRTSDAYAYRFIHGLRFFSMYGVVLGHAFTIFNQTNYTRLVNALHYGDSLWFCIILSGYLCVDTFLFIGGFLLTYNIMAAKESRLVVSISALIRRFIRGTLPALFVMLLALLTPVFFDGPRIQEWYSEYKQQFAVEWVAVLFQFRNFLQNPFSHGTPCMGHLWYLSVDYQLFLVVVITLALTKHKHKPVHFLMFCYSVACALFVAIYIYNSIFMPFVLPMAENWDIIKRTIFEFYMYTPVHATLYFQGVSTYLLIRQYKGAKISPLVSAACWICTVTGVAVAVFGTYPWNKGDYPGEGVKVLFAVTHRPLWGVFMMWLTFCCATGRAATITKILSSSVFVCLSRLTFGVYLIHLPLFFVELNTARDNLFYGAIPIISRSFSCLVWSLIIAYFLFLLIEAPLGRLEKLIFSELRQRRFDGNQKQLSDVESGEKKVPAIMDGENGHSNHAYNHSHEQLPTLNGNSVKL